MFGSKNKQQQNQAEVSIETMEGNLKGEGSKKAVIGYSQEDSSQGVASKEQSLEKVKDTVIQPTKASNDTANTNSPFKMSFSKPNLPSSEPNPAKQESLRQGSFPADIDNPAIKIPKKEDSAFLHQTIDKETAVNNTATSKTQAIETPQKKKKGTSSFILIILFIILLAGIIFGGYYFYMNKSNIDANNTTNTKENSKMAEQTKNTNKTNKENRSTQTTPKQETSKKQTIPSIEKVSITINTFSEDLAKFVKEIKIKRSAIDLQNGIFVNPVKITGEAVLANELLEALHMTSFFKQGDLKDSCKIFIKEDGGEIKVAIIFELTDTADDKLIKNNIIQKETELVKKMSYLFVDQTQPVVPAKIHFATNKQNMEARYMNYTPGVDKFSVDWSILDLGKGRLIYFATSRQTAKTLTDYFMRTVIK